MVLRGIIDYSLNGQVTVRGFAPLGVLERISMPVQSYQRPLEKSHVNEIEKFLKTGQYLFFPEIILGHHIKYDYERKYAKQDTKPLAFIMQGSSFSSNEVNAKYYTRNNNYKSLQDARGKNDILICSIEIDDRYLQECIDNENLPFTRIDGNHRLDACKKNSSLSDIATPFCIVLFDPTDRDSFKFEKGVFNNINSKGLPLRKETLLSSIIDDKISFNNIELKESFGEAYLFVRNVCEAINLSDYVSLKNCFAEGKYKVEKTFFLDLFNFLKEKKSFKFNSSTIDNLKIILSDLNIFYNENKNLQVCEGYGILISLIYYEFLNNRFIVESFKKWVLINHIYNITEIKAKSLVSIFDAISKAKSRQIFLSMPFNGDDAHSRNIEAAIKELNEEFKLDIKLKQLRIDKLSKGGSYPVLQEIIELIKESGLLIADLTGGNKNVYHEVGVVMGMQKVEPIPKNSFILIHRKQKGKPIEKELGFNLRNYQVLEFKEVDELKTRIKDELKIYYGL